MTFMETEAANNLINMDWNFHYLPLPSNYVYD